MLSTRTRYSIIALVEVAQVRAQRQGEERPVRLSAIARHRKLPLSYLEQLAAKWRRAGLVRGVRGPMGGYLLARTPEDITIADIAAAVGETISLVCDGDEVEHARRAGCPAQKISDLLTAKVHAALSAVTLADIARQSAPEAGSDATVRDHHAAPVVPVPIV